MALQNSICSLCLPRALDFSKDGGAFGLPAVGGWLEIMMRQVDVDGGDEFADAPEAALSDHLVGELAKEAFDQVHPRRTGGGEVQMNAGMLRHPITDHGVFVRRIIVD